MNDSCVLILKEFNTMMRFIGDIRRERITFRSDIIKLLRFILLTFLINWNSKYN